LNTAETRVGEYSTIAAIITRPASGAYTWSYVDVFQRERKRFGLAFGGGSTDEMTEYDRQGRVKWKTKPRFSDPWEPCYFTVFDYDALGRVGEGAATPASLQGYGSV